jgi:hypothetical protein
MILTIYDDLTEVVAMMKYNESTRTLLRSRLN